MASLESLAVGEVLDGRYEIESILGQGGYGQVYRALQKSTGQVVAIKLLHPARLVGRADARVAVARFEREMQVIGKLKHPHIVRLLDSGRLTDGALFSVLEFVDGVTLGELIEAEQGLEPQLARRLMGQVAEALCCAHDRGVVHRDLKPQNIMVSGHGALRSAKVLDFGIAAIAEASRDEDYETLTATGQVHGTVAYMAPEQLRERAVTPQTDIYAWGLVLLECLTGRPVFAAGSYAAIIYQQMSPEPVALPPELRGHCLSPVIERAVAKALDARFASARELLDALESVALEPGLARAHLENAETQPDPAEAGLSTGDVGDGWQLGDTAVALATTDAASQPGLAALESRPGRSARWPLAALGGVVLLGAGLLWWAAGGAPSPVRAERESLVAAAAQPPAAGDGELLEIPIDDALGVPSVERHAHGRRQGSRPYAAAPGSPPMETPGGTGVVLNLADVAAPRVGRSDDIVLDALRLDFAFNSDKLHTASYTLRNRSDEARTVRIGVPVELVCRVEAPATCLVPSPTEHVVRLDGERVEGRLVGPLSGERELGVLDPETGEWVDVAIFAPLVGRDVARDAQRYGYDFLYVIEVAFAPGQSRALRDQFPRSGTVEGVANTLAFSVRGAETWGDARMAQLELRIDFGGATSHCVASNLPGASWRGRRLGANLTAPPLERDLIVRWVQPRTLVEALLRAHPGVALRTSDGRVEAGALASVLASKGAPVLTELYDALRAAHRASEPHDGQAVRCEPVSRERLLGDGDEALALLTPRADRHLALRELDPVSRALLPMLAAELARRGIDRPEPPPP